MLVERIILININQLGFSNLDSKLTSNSCWLFGGVRPMEVIINIQGG
jgi:hypothetical protein